MLGMRAKPLDDMPTRPSQRTHYLHQTIFQRGPDYHHDWKLYNARSACGPIRLAASRRQKRSIAISRAYNEEVTLTDTEKLDALRRPKRVTIIVAQTGDGSNNWTQADWAGQVTLLGPFTRAEYLAPYLKTHEEGRRLSLAELDATFLPVSSDDSSAVYWHMTALYVLDEHRRRGLGDQLCRKAFEVIQEHANGAASELRIVIKPGNGIVARMYERLGFETREGRSTLAEAIAASEGSGALPVDYAKKEAYFGRKGLIMVKRESAV